MKHGKIVNAKIYQKVCRPHHFMGKFQGFGISTYELDEMLIQNIELIRIIYQGKTEMTTYVCSVKQYLESNKTHTFENDDLQKFVSASDMIIQQKVKKNEHRKSDEYCIV